MIPARVLQTWRSASDLPPACAPFVARVREECARLGFAWALHDDRQVRQLVAERFPHLLALFDGLEVIQRMDLWRYLAIYEHGGFYLDIDCEPTAKFARLADFRARPAVQVERDAWADWAAGACRLPELGQFFFGFPARDPLLGQVIAETVRRLERRPFRHLNRFQEVLHTSGPGAFGAALWPARAALQLFRPDTFVRHHCLGSWVRDARNSPRRLLIRWQRARYVEV